MRRLCCNRYIKSDEEIYEDIQEISQEFTSENTSINSSKLPAIFKMVSFEPGTINVDYGGGKFDNVADYLTQYDVINLVYDPYNRSADHNKEVVSTVRKAGGADTATCSNVLNVIKEPEVRQNVLRNISKLVKPGVRFISPYMKVLVKVMKALQLLVISLTARQQNTWMRFNKSFLMQNVKAS